MNGIADAALVEGDTVDHVNEHSSYPHEAPFPAVLPRLNDFAPASVQRMDFPGDLFDRGRIRPGMPRRADWLGAVPDGCLEGYRERMAFDGYAADVVTGPDGSASDADGSAAA